ncbi:MAG: hypothetical protein H3C60_04110 [Sphingomonadaceae bacterium]|nr:hypothetical protein [Sphingomonadaceae bacterium]
MDTSVILDEAIAIDLAPIRAGSIILYPASALEDVFDWADQAGRTLEWLEGAFYDLTTGKGQLSLSYMCERGNNYSAFKEKSLDLAAEIQVEAAEIGMNAYFEIGISPK